jgi:hypothetical protein
MEALGLLGRGQINRTTHSISTRRGRIGMEPETTHGNVSDELTEEQMEIVAGGKSVGG